MTQQQLWALLKDVAWTWAQEGIVYTREQVQACEAAFIRLMEESREEQALTIFNALLLFAKTKENPWRWLTAELLLEAYAIALDDRAEAASHYLRFGNDLADEMLDKYNERIRRFSEQALPLTTR